jgi:2,3-bisphosphoglycerate-dependent phosphoglycerate mutase
VHRHWRLNERHYGMLTGQLKADAVAEHGAAQVKLWRHAYSIPPPRVAESHPLHPRHDKKYAHVPAHELPCGECLHQTLERCRPFFESHIAPELRRGRNVLVAAHGHVIRALIKELEQLSDDEVSHVSVPNGVPLVYKVDEALRPIAPLDHIGGSAAARGRYSCLGEWLDFCILDSRQQSSEGAG